MVVFKKVILITGLLLMVIALGGIIYLFTPLIQAEIAYRRPIKDAPVNEIPPGVGNSGFSLEISKIKAKSQIIANIDADNPHEYLPALKQGVAHAKGSVFPGVRGTIWLFAHSTNAPWNIIRYNAVFFLLNELAAGDQIKLNFLGGDYLYSVREKRIVARTETQLFSQRGEHLLVLQTCYPPGTTQKALLVIAEQVSQLQ